jgi:TolA-binding protein
MMSGRTSLMAFLAAVQLIVSVSGAQAQDVPGIEICTAEKTMERRTSCLQSNVNFLQQTIGKLRLDQQQKLDAANRQVEALRTTVIGLQKTVDEMQAAQKKPASATGKDTPVPVKDAPAKDAPAAK